MRTKCDDTLEVLGSCTVPFAGCMRKRPRLPSTLSEPRLLDVSQLAVPQLHIDKCAQQSHARRQGGGSQRLPPPHSHPRSWGFPPPTYFAPTVSLPATIYSPKHHRTRISPLCISRLAFQTPKPPSTPAAPRPPTRLARLPDHLDRGPGVSSRAQLPYALSAFYVAGVRIGTKVPSTA